MAKLLLKSVKKPMRLQELGFWLYSFWEGRIYGKDDLVPVDDANKILARAREKRLNSNG